MSLFLLFNQFNIWYGILLEKTRSFRKMFKQLLILGLTFVASRYKANTRNSPILYFLSWRTQDVCAKSLQSCLTLQSYALQSTRIFCPWDSPGKNIGVGCHGDLSDPGIEPTFFMSLGSAGEFFTSSATWEQKTGFSNLTLQIT